MIKVYVKDRFNNGIRNEHCNNVEPYGGSCKHKDHWQEGGGWSDRTYIYCDYLCERVYMDPPIPSQKQKRDGDYYILLPDNCPVKGSVGQLNIFRLLMQKGT